MTINQDNNEQNWYGPACYEIKIRGNLSEQASNIFGGMHTSFANGITIIRCDVVDQSALHGILNQIRNLGIQLISLKKIDPDSNKEENKS